MYLPLLGRWSRPIDGIMRKTMILPVIAPLMLPPILSVSLTGCAMQGGSFPSLAKRPFEDVVVQADPPSKSEEVTSLSGAIKTQVDQEIKRSIAADQSFASKFPAVQAKVSAAAGAALSSEKWVDAQVALSALETERGPAVSALANLDALYRDQLDNEYSGSPVGSAAIIAAAIETVQNLVGRQQADVEKLRSTLRQ